LIAAQTLLLVTLLVLVLTRPTLNPTVTSPPDTSRLIIIREIYEIEKKHDSIYKVFADSITSVNTTESLLSILRQHDKRN
jgi:hypothetical protein